MSRGERAENNQDSPKKEQRRTRIGKLEVGIGSIVDILEHSGCSSLKGKVVGIRSDDTAVISCINPKCGKTVMPDVKAINASVK